VYTGSRADLVFVASKFRMHRHLGEKFGSIKNVTEFDNFKSSILAELDSIGNVTIPDASADIVEILKAYPNKGLVAQIQGKLELSKNGYKNLVLSFISSEKRKDIMEVIAMYLPKIE
jgi:hypothetical protein